MGRKERNEKERKGWGRREIKRGEVKGNGMGRRTGRKGRERGGEEIWRDGVERKESEGVGGREEKREWREKGRGE